MPLHGQPIPPLAWEADLHIIRRRRFLLVSICFFKSAIIFCSASSSFLYCDMKLSWTIRTATLFVFGSSLG